MARKTTERRRRSAARRLRASVSKSKSKSKANGGARRNGSQRAGAAARRKESSPANDAIGLLKADHRQVESWFKQFEKASSDARREELAGLICAALEAHTTIEEEIFYPAFLDATDDEKIHHEAEIEHEGAKRLIAEIEASGANDDHFGARVTVLSEMIRHHVNEEEKRGGMFAKARRSAMDLEELGRRMKARKAEVMSGRRSPVSAEPLEERA